jgi:hypothetical protein
MGVAIVQFQKKQEAKFICSACGADRGCDCNAPAVEKLAEKLEQDRQRARKARDKKKILAKSNNASRDDFKWNEPLELARTATARKSSGNAAWPTWRAKRFRCVHIGPDNSASGKSLRSHRTWQRSPDRQRMNGMQ